MGAAALAVIVAVALAAGGSGSLFAGDGADEPSGASGDDQALTSAGGSTGPGAHRQSSDQAPGSAGDDRGSAAPSQARRSRPGSGRGGVRLVQIGEFNSPTFVTGAPGFPRLKFVTEQPGRVRVIVGSRVLRRPFLDISGGVTSGGEQGMLSVAFPPDYQRTRRFYVYYTDHRGDIRIDEFRRRSPVTAAPNSRRPILHIRHREFSNHNGGQLAFLGNHLYVGTGDGGGGGDPQGNAQNRRSLLGKLLRIDPRRGQERAYRIPPNNPFVGRPGRPEIFSYGLRNPWRFSFDRARGRPPRLAIADVGQDSQEEVNYVSLRGAHGANFGWNLREGFAPYESNRTAGLTHPVFAYGRSQGCSITGGYVVNSRRLPSLYRRYLFADFCDGRLRSFVPRAGRVRAAPAVGVSVESPSSFGRDRRGRIYVTSLAGPVYMLAPDR